MSLSLIAWNPRIEEPSNPIPSANSSPLSSFSGRGKCCHVHSGSVNIDSTVQRRHEVPKLHSRKFPEALLDLTLRPLEEDPAGGAAMLPVHEMHAPPHRANLGVRLHLGEHVPSFITALQLTHVLGAVLAREGGAHGVKSWLTRLHYAASPIPAS